MLSSLKVDDIAKNLDGVGTAVRSLFKSLTQGKSLMERMHEFEDDSSSNAVDGSSISDQGPSADDPFIDTGSPANVSDNPFEDPFKTQAPASGEKLTSADGRENSSYLENLDSDLIRKVTPIEDPVFEIKDEYKVDGLAPPQDDGYSDITAGAPEGSTISCFSDNSMDQNIADNSLDGLSSDVAADPLPDESISISKEDIELVRNISTDVHEIKLRIESSESRYEDVETSVSILSNTISDLNSVASQSEKNAELISSTNDNFVLLGEKVETISDNVTTLETAMHVLKSDKDSIRSDLVRIEDSIAELVNSYTALLVQVHESSELSDSRLSKLEKSLELLDQYETRFASIEHAQGESASTSRELAKSISSLVDEFGASSSQLDSFKESSVKRSNELARNIDSVTEYLDSELKKLGARSYKGFGQNVHLSNIVKNSSNMKLCMEWLEYLMELVGRNNLSEILSYYEDLGWLTEEVKMELINYAEGIDFYMEKPDWKLTPDDHVKSIWFIENLAGMKVDKNRLSVIDRDIEKVKKGTEIYGI